MGNVSSFNMKHRHSRNPHQNRCDFILCQEDVYLLEFVRYIYLNPLRGSGYPI